MRSIEDTRTRWSSLFRDNDTTPSDLRAALKSDQGENLCVDGLRSICWKAFLLFEDLDRGQWARKISDLRTTYSALRAHFFKYIEHPDDLQSSVDPLADDEESPWQTLRHDEQLRADIAQDVDRCLQENMFFRDPAVKRKMTDVLFIYSKLNPDLGYRQGMHELLAPILWVVDRDAIQKDSLEGDTPADEDDSMLLQLLDAAHVEHDSFSLFCAVMQSVRVYYEHSEQRSANGQVDSIPIVGRCQYVHTELLAATDLELAEHLQALEILPQVFLTRWMRLLFGREFMFDEVLLVWDYMFAEGLRAELIDFICVAMLLRVRWQLLNADCSTALMLLLRYPSPEPHPPQSFVRDGIYLEQNPTPDRGKFIISKYSGRPLESSKSPDLLNSRLAPARKSRFRRDLKGVSESESPASSPGRSNSRGLETLFQDVSDGIQRRTETWGVAKAVRGAMSEARKNIQTIQSEASHHPSLHPREISWAKESKAVIDLNTRIERLEDRNKALAKTLSEAWNDLRAQMEKVADLDPGVSKAMQQNLARIQSVQTCLEDPTAALDSIDKPPTPDGDTDGTTSEKSKSVERDTPDMMKKDHEPASVDASRTSSKSPVETELQKHSERTSSESSIPIQRRPSIRPSLAESEFSWMLGGGRNVSSFVSSASVPPEQTRQHNALFGNGGNDEDQRKTEAEPDGLAMRMRSLRGSKDRE